MKTLARTSICSLAFLLVLASGPLCAAPASLTVDAARPGVLVSPLLYGIFFEDINCSADGGIYAELIRNRSLEDSDKPEHWSALSSGSAKVEVTVDASKPLSPKNPHALKVAIGDPDNGRAGVANGGFWGISILKGEAYNLSLEARANEGFAGPLTVSLESADEVVYAEGKISRLTPEWKNYTLSLKARQTDPKARLVIAATQPGTFWLDMVSLFPKKTWKDRANGLRPDLAEMLAGLKPAFVRFPGGCWVEGDTMKLAYRWKQTIGAASERRTQYNIWQYHATHGVGYHEYLLMCEDLGAEPLFVINCGMSHRENIPIEQMGEFVQDALDAIEYANGPATSQWGALRAQAGHPAPFHLQYVEIGNENGGRAYQERYALFYDAIKAKYPRIKLIANVPATSRPADIVDEHYYNSPNFFINNAHKYDSYDRRGPKIYVGEYAVTVNGGAGNLRAALGEAAFMTGMERNADVVIMSSYAPLFANIHYKKWNPDLINFDSSRVYGTPSYYVQKLFAENRAEVILPVQLETAANASVPVPRGAVGVGTWLTQSEYKDFKVTQGDKVLWAADSIADTKGWRFHGGKWQPKDGALQQSDSGDDRRAVIGDTSWADYTLSLKARKISGREGFLIMFHVQDDANWIWWNLGGWGNTRHAIERCEEGGKSGLAQGIAGKIETGRWYNVRIDLAGTKISCYLDNKLVEEASVTPVPRRPMYAVAGSGKGGEIVLKVVNVSNEPQETKIHLPGVKSVERRAQAIVLTSASPADENSLVALTRVVPVTRAFNNAAANFSYTFPANSLNVLRLQTKN